MDYGRETEFGAEVEKICVGLHWFVLSAVRSHHF